MGCFSFLCYECDKGINSDSFSGEMCMLFLLKDGVIIERMLGQYDSYGRVFDKNMKSIKWKMDWSDICVLMFSNNPKDGIAGVHLNCFSGKLPTIQSDHDPDQGWNSYKIEGEIRNEQIDEWL